MIPQQTQGTQAWDRYAYTNNNPVRYSDPTGHFANILIGSAIGAAVNVGLYMWNEVGRQDGFDLKSDWKDLAVAAAQGAVVGGLIGSGVGASAGVSLAMSAGLGAASSLVSTQVGNLITGEDYNAATSTVDAATGAVSGMLTQGSGSQAVKNVIAGGVQTAGYSIDSLITGDDITAQGLAGSFVSGAIGQAWGSSSAVGMMSPRYEDFGTDVLTMTYKGLSRHQAEIASAIFVPAFQQMPESLIKYLNRHTPKAE